MSKNLDIDFITELSSDQNLACNKFRSWLEKKTFNEPFVLSGYAGSGKTFLAIKFLKLAEKKKLSWTVAAPTHKAVGVLRKALATDGMRSIFYPSTIHRLLRLKIKRNGDMEFFEETKETAKSLEELSLVIIDESSMINKKLLEIIIKYAYLAKTRLVFIGDQAQLAPIGEKESPVFVMTRVINAHLNEVIRHQGPILQLANNIRNEIIPCKIPPCLPKFQSSQGLVVSLERNSWLEAAKSSLKEASDNDNPDEARILCYTNKVLERLVPHARRAIHGEMANQLSVLPGEVLMTRKIVLASASTEGGDSGEEPDILIPTNREMVVIDITPHNFDFSKIILFKKFDWNIPIIATLLAKVKCGDKEFSLRLLPPIGTSSRENLDNFMNKLSKLAKETNLRNGKQFWRAFFFLRDAFASVGPASVLTVHRSQGSTFEKVFVASDVFWPNDLCLRKQLVYVATSRASREVWLVGESNKNVEEIDIWKNQFKSYL